MTASRSLLIAALSTLLTCASTPSLPARVVGGGPSQLQSMSLGEIFAYLDLDDDGFLSLDEFLAAPVAGLDPAEATARFAEIDTDGDGRISWEEFLAALTEG